MAIIKNPTREELRAWKEQCKKQKDFTDRMIHYKAFIDNNIKKQMINEPKYWDRTIIKEWLLKVKPIVQKLPTTDYDNNILFVCDEKTVRETFFAAFYKLRLLVEYRFMDLFYARELWYGRCNSNILPTDIFGDVSSFREVREDILCTFVSSSMQEVDVVPEIWTTVIASRSVNSGMITRSQNTWIYYQGTIDGLRDSPFSLWESFFERNGLIIDLNPQKQDDFGFADIYSPF